MVDYNFSFGTGNTYYINNTTTYTISSTYSTDSNSVFQLVEPIKFSEEQIKLMRLAALKSEIKSRLYGIAKNREINKLNKSTIKIGDIIIIKPLEEIISIRDWIILGDRSLDMLHTAVGEIGEVAGKDNWYFRINFSFTNKSMKKFALYAIYPVDSLELAPSIFEEEEE